MKLASWKLVGALFASLSLMYAGPAWSSPSQAQATKSVAKHKVKSNAQARAKAKAKLKARAKAMVKAPVAAKPRIEAAVESVAVPAAVAAVPPLLASVVVVAPPMVSHAPALAPANLAKGEPAAVAPAYQGNPYLAYSYYPNGLAAASYPVLSASGESNGSSTSSGGFLSDLKAFLPNLPGADGRSILPSIKRVYPTGEKPLVVLTFKCPTEMIGITPPPMKALHGLVDLGFDGLNATNLLSFNLQQVCQ